MALKKKQAEALELLKKGYNLFLSGEAGTGKSFVIEQFIKYLEKNKIKYVVGAPTGLAALNVGGTTLHRMFGLGIDLFSSKITMKNVEEAEVIIIDEISMCRRDTFQKIARAIFSFENPLEELDIKEEARICRKKQIVVVGDFFQLPPIVSPTDIDIINQIKDNADNEEQRLLYKDILDLEQRRYAFECKEWEQFEFKNIVLNEVVRQSDKDYIDNLNKVRVGDSSGLEFIKKNSKKTETRNAIYLSSNKKSVKSLNDSSLAKIKEKAYKYKAEIDGEVKPSEMATEVELVFKPGARVMSVVNVDENIVNGMTGTVVELDKEGVTVDLDNGEVYRFKKHTWEVKGFKKEKVKDKNGNTVEKVIQTTIGSFKQIPLRLSWAITIHKSQGQTYEAVNLDPRCFAEGQLYVALSRAKDLKKLHITKNIDPSYLKTSERVKDFYKKIEQGGYDIEITSKEVATTIEEGFIEVEDYLEITEEFIGTETEEEYITIKIPKNLEEQVLRLLEGKGNDNINNEEVECLKRQIEDLKTQLEETKASAKRRPQTDQRIKDEIIRLKKSGLTTRVISTMIGVSTGTVSNVWKEYNSLNE